MVRVDDPTFAFLMKDSAMVVVQKGHGVFFTTRGEFSGGARGEESDNEGMCVFG